MGPISSQWCSLGSITSDVYGRTHCGVFVDGWDDKRKTMLWMHSICLLLVLLLFPLTGLLPLPFVVGELPILWQLGAIYTMTLLIGTFAQFFNLAEMALLSDIVEETYRT